MARAPRPCQSHGSEEKGENKRKKEEKKWTDRTLGQMAKAKLYRQKSHKDTYTYTLRKRENGKHIYKKRRKRATKSINKSTNDTKL